ncbi:hypothetical protein Mmc1_0284 [Magnetococcus marinus MC-1]|uniref:Uncharacterized protein n=1 Tax=Magnetococcus marinus (strain ATCC BAA-1437 / JCM 17883 / MC-1) TaxID=156889 RepID=A0L4B8_MAGMM|nr:hypothetical protein [Magnetococcus marinus]ABK42811.1 hypothetical protein Mmc1_0284 [Magnetococcus marinus MC-1]
MLHITSTAHRPQGPTQTKVGTSGGPMDHASGFDTALEEASRKVDPPSTVDPVATMAAAVIPPRGLQNRVLSGYDPAKGIVTPEALRQTLSREEMEAFGQLLNAPPSKEKVGDHPLPPNLEKRWMEAINGLSTDLRAALTKLLHGESKDGSHLQTAAEKGLPLEGLSNHLLTALEADRESIPPATYRAWRLRIDDLQGRVAS